MENNISTYEKYRSCVNRNNLWTAVCIAFGTINIIDLINFHINFYSNQTTTVNPYARMALGLGAIVSAGGIVVSSQDKNYKEVNSIIERRKKVEDSLAIPKFREEIYIGRDPELQKWASSWIDHVKEESLS